MNKKDPSSLIVPPLREDLRLYLRPAEEEEEACCVIYDPIAHRYHELNQGVFDILKSWSVGITIREFSERLTSLLKKEITIDELFHLMLQLDHAGLFSQPLNSWRNIYDRQQKRRYGIFTWMIHNYLFIRIPLVKPDKFLTKTLPIAQFFLSKKIIIALLFIGLWGVYTVSRQWDAFWNTFLHFFSFKGLIGYIFALVFVKIFHELGHAYTAKNFGCRVPTMGLAFLVLAPVLYTDVTDAWKLKSRKERLLISSGGVLVEFAIAAIAIFMWSMLPEGTMKSACFFIATTSFVVTILINISPLMRFDGYYLLSDYLRISNLQHRAFRLMCWAIRELLFGLKDPCPEEDWSSSRRMGIVFYAVVVCIYRFFLFLGIALLVYYMTTKLLGILLFIIEIVFFILRPIQKEIIVWWNMREKIIQARRVYISGSIFFVSFMFTAIPFPHSVAVPAVIEPIFIQRIVVPMHSRIKKIMVKNGDVVKRGDVLIELVSDLLAFQIDRINIELNLARLKRDRRVVDVTDKNQTFVLNQEILRFNETLSGMKRLQEELVIRAKADGTVTDLIPYLHEGRWVQKDQQMGIVAAIEGWQVRGYIHEHFVPAIKTGAKGLFISDDPFSPSFKVRLQSIGLHSAPVIDIPALISHFGGEIAVNEDKKKGYIPIEAQYQVVLTPEKNELFEKNFIKRGIVRIEAKPESFAWRTIKRAISIMIRESGF